MTAPWRSRHIKRIDEIGRRAWRAESGQQAKAENAVSRFTRIIGPRLRASGESARTVEIIAGCNILNMMTGRPDSYSMVAEAIAG